MNKPFRSRLLIPVLLAIMLFTPMLADTPVVSAAAPLPEIWQRTELYFGTAKTDGVVTDTEFAAFVDAFVTPRFPSGVTVLAGNRQFQISGGGVIVKERVLEVVLLYPLSMRDANRKIEEIRTAYKTNFQQQSVVRVDSLVAISF